MKRHVSIMTQEILDMIPHHAKCIVDGTMGHAGHLQYFLENFVSSHTDEVRYIGCDVDPAIYQQAKAYLQGYSESEAKKVLTINKSYAELEKILAEHEIGPVDFVLLDLGINREHVLNGDRGFSLRKDGPLDMRFAPDRKTAYEVLLESTIDQLMQWLIMYGDYKPHVAKGYAQYIKKNIHDPLMKTTRGFRELMRKIRVNDRQLAVLFQVLRIVVNNELEHVEKFLTIIPSILAKYGRCAIITFHSIEDRLVKYGYKALVAQGDCVLVNKRVITPHYTEVQKNKAARSAKLRVIEKI